jgi:hypothetical protein
MQMVQDNLLYVDTDSLVYIHKPGHVDPPTGNFLGDLTNELKPGQHITEFVSLGTAVIKYVLSLADAYFFYRSEDVRLPD